MERNELKRKIWCVIIASILIAGFFVAAVLTYPNISSWISGGNKEESPNFSETDYPYLNSHAAVEVEIILPPEAGILEINATATRCDNYTGGNQILPIRQIWFYIKIKNPSNGSTVTIKEYTEIWTLKTAEGKILKQGTLDVNTTTNKLMPLALNPGETKLVQCWYECLDDLPSEEIKYVKDVHLLQVEVEIRDIEFQRFIFIHP